MIWRGFFSFLLILHRCNHCSLFYYGIGKLSLSASFGDRTPRNFRFCDFPSFVFCLESLANPFWPRYRKFAYSTVYTVLHTRRLPLHSLHSLALSTFWLIQLFSIFVTPPLISLVWTWQGALAHLSKTGTAFTWPTACRDIAKAWCCYGLHQSVLTNRFCRCEMHRKKILSRRCLVLWREKRWNWRRQQKIRPITTTIAHVPLIITYSQWVI